MALLNVNDGSVAFGDQRSGSSFGPYPESVLPLDDGTKGLYGDITGQYMQDVTLTPRFDVSASSPRRCGSARPGSRSTASSLSTP